MDAGETVLQQISTYWEVAKSLRRCCRLVLVHRPLVEVFNSKTGVSCTEGGILVAMIEILNSITTIPITAAADVFSPWLVQLVPVNQREGEELDVSLDGLVSELAGT